MKKVKKFNFFWFRRDLRINDNHGLYKALNSKLPVVPIFIFDKNILEPLSSSDSRVIFIHESLLSLQKEIEHLGSGLITFHGDPVEVWKKILNSYEVGEVFTNEDYEPYAIKRDDEIQELLAAKGSHLNVYKDNLIFAKDDILKKDGTPYTVYTPYKNKWRDTLTPRDLASYRSGKLKNNFQKSYPSNLHSLKELGFVQREVCFPSRIIKKNKIESYHQTRDIPSKEGTSLLGLHLRFGTISIRKAAATALETNEVWLNELIWREFFSQILYHFSYVENAPFKSKYDKIKWINDKDQFRKWKEGRTGFPLIDAGMRELNATGHMHNRVRMLVASFLIKDLLIDWRWGERYFAEKLLDYDLASNNGNWQWAAGTGCDAAPYFRIFNPTTQLKKFDPDLKYVMRWVPEYGTEKYTPPIVDHREAYHRAILTYNKALK